MATKKASNVLNVSFEELRKKRIVIDGDENRVIELNTSDLSMVTRLEEGTDKLEALSNSVTDIANGQEEGMGAKLKQIDRDMRDYIDYIFDEPGLADKCSPHGNMFDPINGALRYDIIITNLVQLYEMNIVAETEKMKAKVDAHTGKYTNKK